MEEPNTEILIPASKTPFNFKRNRSSSCVCPMGSQALCFVGCVEWHLAINGQVERIKRTEVIADDLVYVRVQTDGGPQIMPTLVLGAVPYWLATIDTRRMEKNDPRRQEILDINAML